MCSRRCGDNPIEVHACFFISNVLIKFEHILSHLRLMPAALPAKGLVSVVAHHRVGVGETVHLSSTLKYMLKGFRVAMERAARIADFSAVASSRLMRYSSNISKFDWFDCYCSVL
jgi:hypothetical protein